MTEIRTPVLGFTGQVAGVDFVDGVGDTDNEAALAYFRRHGYRVVEPVTEPPYPAGRPSQPWTVPQLKAWAVEHDVDLTEARTKPEILEAVLASIAVEPPDGGPLVGAEPETNEPAEATPAE